ncbi:uncharacterized protein LOC126815577 [Patella vulgata]|uniref:uncharacterized protein LOC126815577 n=1 Tax=Patella vulgata TaxID=6465 RepID=UPI00217FE9B6|nr:uncharacterized protein LOC126815577 [Patella vulgata]
MDVSNEFIDNLVKNIQLLCHKHVPFNDNLEIIGHLYLNVDGSERLNYIVNERCRKTNHSLIFTSNSYHAPPGNTRPVSKEKIRKSPKKHKISPNKEIENPCKVRRLTRSLSHEDAASCVDDSLNVSFDIPNEEQGGVIEKSALENFIIIGPSTETNYIHKEIDKSLEAVDDRSLENDSHEVPELSTPAPLELDSIKTEELYLQQSEDTAEELILCSEVLKVEEDSDQELRFDSQDDNIDYTIVEMGTKKGRSMLVDSIGYSYSVRRRTDKSIQWTCTIRNKSIKCAASVVQIGESFTPGPNPHTHEPKPGLLTSTLITAEARAQANNDFFTPTNEVVERAMTVKGGEDDSFLPKQCNLKRMINRYRQLKRVSLFPVNSS